MNDVVQFSFEGSGVRVIERDGEPWFVAKDVAALLGYAKPRNAVAEHCKGGIVLGLPSAGGMQATTIIPERDVYRLIMRSKLPAAERFEEWVVGEVLPSIRGGLYQPGPSGPPTTPMPPLAPTRDQPAQEGHHEEA